MLISVLNKYQFLFLIFNQVRAICPMHDAVPGFAIKSSTATFQSVEGSNGTGIHVTQAVECPIPTQLIPSVIKERLESTKKAMASNLVSAGYGKYAGVTVVNSDGYAGGKQIYQPGYHGLDYDLFARGGLNHSTTKSLDGSFYGRSDDDPFINNLIKYFKPEKLQSNLINKNIKTSDAVKSNLASPSGTGKRFAVGDVPDNGNGKEANSLAAEGKGGTVGSISASGSTGRSFKFTQNSVEAVLSDYTRAFVASKIYAFNPTADGLYNITLVSTTKEYHPQLKLFEINKGGGEKYVERFGTDRENGMYSSRYSLRRDREYLIEIGASELLDFTPFVNINTGKFICIVTSEKKSLQGVLGQQDYRVSFYGRTAIVPLKQGEFIEFAGDSTKEGAGMLDYAITPFFNENRGSLTIFYHDESGFSNKLSSTSKEATIVEFECDLSAKQVRIVEGEAVTQKIIEFKIPSRSVCDLVDMLK